MRRGIVLLVGLGALALMACNKSENADDPQQTSTAAPTPVATTPPPAASTAAAPAPSTAAQKVEIQIESVKNTMAYDKTKLTVPTGAEVHLVLVNHATMQTLPHNWVLVQPGTQAKVAAQGLAEAPDAGWVVEGPNVLAYTPLAPPGGTTEVTFTAPAPGTYPYICTVPGHYMMMKGTLTVTP